MAFVAAEFLQALDSELFLVPVECVGDPVGTKKHGIARAQPHRQTFVARVWEQSRWNPRELQWATAIGAKVKRAGHARARDMQISAAWIKHRILGGRVPPGHAAHQKPPVESGKGGAWRRARLVDASQSPDGQ